MKKLTLILTLFCGLTFSSSAEVNSKLPTASQSEEVTTIGENNNSQIEATTNSSELSKTNPNPKDKKQKHWKEFKDRTVVGKVVLIAGVAVFVVLCVLFGSVSVG